MITGEDAKKIFEMHGFEVSSFLDFGNTKEGNIFSFYGKHKIRYTIECRYFHLDGSTKRRLLICIQTSLVTLKCLDLEETDAGPSYEDFKEYAERLEKALGLLGSIKCLLDPVPA